MAKAVLVCNRESIYDDLPEVHYHYPRQYAGRMEQVKGDWIIYYESGSNRGRQVYFATARVVGILPDEKRSDHFYAIIANYTPFPNPVPWLRDIGHWETAFDSDSGQSRGNAQNAVRQINDRDYEAIVAAGTAHIFESDTATQSAPTRNLSEEQREFQRPIVERLVSEPFRSAVFAKCIRAAYDSTCAATGLKLINGGGRCEIEAAHIRPVGDGHDGPDSVRNGLALSRTMHWLFDRGIISLKDNGKILFASKRHFPEIDRVKAMVNPDEKMALPSDLALRPHPQFLSYHRDVIHAPKAS